MTLTSHPGLVVHDPDQGQTPGRESESVSGRFGRWLRYAPAERVPLAGIPAVWTAAEIMHAAGVSDVFTGAATLAAAGLAYGLGERHQGAEHPRLRGAELAAATMGAGAWAVAAGKWGPLAGPCDLLTLIYAAGTGCGYWWLYAHEAVRAARARRDAAAAEAAAWRAKRAEWHYLASRPGVGLHGSHLLRAEPNLNGEVWTVDTYSARRQLASRIDCAQLAQRLAGERGTPRGRVEVTPDPEWVYQLRIFFRKDDPWKGGDASAFIWHPSASGQYDPDAEFAGLVPPQASIRDPVVIGVDPEEGTPLQFPLWDANGGKRVLVIAASGQGKSMLLDTIRERVTACPDARLLQINLSKGVEDSWWEPLTEASALASDANPAAKAQAILDFATDTVKARPNAPARKKGGRRSHQPTPDEPLFVLMIDEYDVVSADPDRRQVVEMLASKVRSEGWALVLAAQRPAGKWVSTSLKANLTHLVWSKMRAGDARHAAGNETFTLPDMGAYGGNNKGIFGVCEHPTYAGMPYLHGRTFFWGDESPGLTRLIAARAAGRVPYVLEPALAGLAGQWAQITGAAPLAARYDLATTRDGQTVPGVTGVRDRLAKVRGILGGAPDAQGGHGHAGDEEALDELLARPGGVSVREAAEVLPWQKTKVHELLAARARAGLAEVRGEGRGARFHAIAPAGPPPAPAGPYPPLRVVPDPAEDAS
jgi:hypothetical protein